VSAADELELARAVVVTGQSEEAHVGTERHHRNDGGHTHGTGGGEGLASLHGSVLELLGMAVPETG